ncbi:hypothetical protein JM64_01660 [Fervidobacterium ngatamarikiense]|uniref:O-antigen ligase domain-containing protein n=1 Tax=Fervidobacterium pennivorans TaxID=93466 RepID=A0A172T1L7_FERPE|nr:hypothetical protein [Fervidobacterium pennivorans]ANE40854.1 hypothetical protein JM64_01660 [Fervidobacterium pennivorans]
MAERNATKVDVEMLTGLGVFFTVISQAKVMWNNVAFEAMPHIIWFLLLLTVFVKRRNLDLDIKFFAVLFLFDLFLLIAQITTGKEYLSSNLVIPIHLSAYVYMVAYNVGKVSRISIFQRAAKYYVASVILLSVFIYINAFHGRDWLNSAYYLYGAKNSAAPIIVVGALLIIIFDLFRSKILKTAVMTFLIVLVFMMKARSSITGLFVSILYYSFVGVKGDRKKFVYAAVIFATVFLVFTNSYLYDLVINRIILINRYNADLDEIASGRISQIKMSKNIFPLAPLVGHGGFSIDSFPLVSLASYGILGSIPVFMLSTYPFLKRLKRTVLDQSEKIEKLIVILGLFMWVVGVFEELSPFGPDTRCFMLWTMAGLYSGIQAKEQYNV